MREIKFRAWNPENKTMYFNVQNSYDTIGFVEPEDLWTNFGSLIKPDYGGVFMWYTGFKDKNGVEIYEGDIVHVTWSNKPQEIVWSDEMLCYTFKSYLSGDSYTDLLNVPEKIEVIGNIYENKDLLK